MKDRGFKTEVVDDKAFLINDSGNIKLLFLVEEDTYSLYRKTTRVFLDTFDSLKADNEIEKFNARRIENWEIIDDSLWTTKALFLGDTYQIPMKMDEIPYLQTTVDLFPRVSVSP